MKTPITLLVVMLLTATNVQSQENQSVMSMVSRLADQVTDMVLRSLPEDAETPFVVAVDGLQVNEVETHLGELFALTIASKLANSNDPRIRVYTEMHLEMLRRSSFDPPVEAPAAIPSPHYVIKGKIFVADEKVNNVISLMQMPDLQVVGGVEGSWPATDAVMSLLGTPSAYGVVDRDFSEPDSRESPFKLVPGEELISRSIDPGGDEDWFTTEANRPEEVGYLHFMTHGGLDTYIEVFGPDDPGELFMESDDYNDVNAGVIFMVDLGEIYWIKVRGYDETVTGFYELTAELRDSAEDPLQPDEPEETTGHIDDYEPDNTVEEAKLITIGRDAQVHTFVPGSDIDWLYFDLEYERIVTIETHGVFDAIMTLYDEDGNEIAEDDDSGVDANAMIEMTLQPGTYFIRLAQVPGSIGSGATCMINVVVR